MKRINSERKNITKDPGLERAIEQFQEQIPLLAEFTPSSIVEFAATKYVGRHLNAYGGNYRNLKDLFEHAREHHRAGPLKYRKNP